MLLLRLVSAAVAGVLIVFTLRRAVLLLVAIFSARSSTGNPFEPQRHDPARSGGAGEHEEEKENSLWPSSLRGEFRFPSARKFILLLIPCRNEAAVLPRLLKRLEELEYDNLGVLLLDDASTDATAEVARAWADGRSDTRVLSIAESKGKASALNAGIEYWESQPGLPRPDLIAVYDADLLPAPESLSILARAFDDPRIAATNGMLLPTNRNASLPAFYAAVETLVNQLVTMLGKDRLRLAPAILGSNCVYRLSALRESGGFRDGFLLEDSDLTVTLARAGYRTRYLPEAVAETTVPQTWRGYWRQHVRWGRGFNQVAAKQSGQLWRGGVPFLLRLELLLFSLGYFDRLALLAALLLILTDFLLPGLTSFHPFLLLPYFLLPLLSMTAVLLRLREPLASFARLLLTPIVFAVDLAAALYSTTLALLRRPAQWTQTERPALPAEARR